MNTKPKVSKSAARAEGTARAATKRAATKKTSPKRPAKSAKAEAAQRSRTAAVGGEGGEVTVTIPLDSLPAQDAGQAKDGAKGGKAARSPTAAPEVEVLTEEDAKSRSGMTEIIKTVKGRDAAIRQAAKDGGFVIAHEDGRYSAAKSAGQVEAHEEAAEAVADAKRPTATTTQPRAAEKSAKRSKGGKAAKAPKERKPKQMSAVDAAAQVLAKAKKPMRAKELIEAMAKQGLWSSPAGKTPEATLYAAMVREINRKGKDARFRKHDRGAFVAAGKGG